MSSETVQMHSMTNTHILLQDFTYLEPRSLREAISLLSACGGRAQVLAGGTYLLVLMKMERQSVECVINLSKIDALKGVLWQEDGLDIAAATTIRTIRDEPGIHPRYAALAEACAAFGSTQIQKMGTIGGNLCNGSPASDAVPALMAFNAQLTLCGPEGNRTMSVQDFLLGPGKTALRADELLTAIKLPACQPGTGSGFVKVSRVAADLAKVSAAAVIVREGDRVVDCRLAFGSVAPTVIRGEGAEQVLIGQVFNPELALEAGRVASEAVSPIDDVRSTAWYRREVVKAVTHDVLCLAWERAEQTDLGDSDEPAKRTGGPSGEENGKADEGERPVLEVGCGEKHAIELIVNGEKHQLWVSPNELLVNVLRERLELTGTKYGCGIGECGACTVHLNGEPALSCLVLAVSADGAEVLTVEGLQGHDGELDPLQDAFIEHQAFQCGFCTPGMLMMTKRLLSEMSPPSETDVREYLRGNRCRCTGFASIVRAVMSQIGSEG